MIKFLLGLFLLVFSFVSDSRTSSLQIQPLWSVNTLKERSLGPNLSSKSSPVLYKELVIQGNAFDGIRAFTRQRGHLVWKYQISGGVSSAIQIFKDRLYFGGGDGFFYVLSAKTGKLVWKFFTGSDNTGSPLIDQGRVYFVSSNQKVYALSLKERGKLLWIHSGPILSENLWIRGQSRPAVYKNSLYVGFSEGSVLALHKKTGRLLWKKTLKSNHSIFSNLRITKRCLLVPVFEAGLFCLNLRKGSLIWKSPYGGTTSPLVSKNLIYQGEKGRIYALRERNGKRIWSVKTEGFPITPSLYNPFLIYGSVSGDSLMFINSKNRKQKMSHLFGKGLASSVTVDRKQKEAYFMSVEGYLHKIKVSL